MTHQHNHNDEQENNHSHEEDDYNQSKDNALTVAFWLNLAFSISRSGACRKWLCLP